MIELSAYLPPTSYDGNNKQTRQSTAFTINPQIAPKQAAGGGSCWERFKGAHLEEAIAWPAPISDDSTPVSPPAPHIVTLVTLTSSLSLIRANLRFLIERVRCREVQMAKVRRTLPRNRETSPNPPPLPLPPRPRAGSG